MHVANRDLCAELYELSRWGRMDNASSTDHYYRAGWVTIKKGEPDIKRDWKVEPWESFNEVARLHLSLDKGKAIPAYDLGYLLRKLPKEIVVGDGMYKLIMQYAGDELRAHYWSREKNKRALSTDYDSGLLGGFGKNEPEDSLAELAIDLFKQGILTKETERDE